MENTWVEHHGGSLERIRTRAKTKLDRLASYQEQLKRLRSQVSRSGKDHVDPQHVADELSRLEFEYSELQGYIGFTFEFWDSEGTPTDEGSHTDKLRSRRIHQCFENIQFRMEGIEKATHHIKEEAKKQISQYVYSKLSSSFIWSNVVLAWTVLARLGQRSGWVMGSVPSVLSFVSFVLIVLSLAGTFFLINNSIPSFHSMLKLKWGFDIIALIALLIAISGLIASFAVS